MTFRVRKGLVPGRNHIVEASNCQDALTYSAFGHGKHSYIVGVIADGCGEGKHSEVGAQLAVQYIPHEVQRLTRLNLPLEHIPQLLYANTIQFLRGVAAAYHFSDVDEYVAFVNHYLLFTIIGFILGPEETWVFAAGDGVVVLNEDIHLRDENNTPSYIGYHLVDRRYLHANASPLETTFDVYRLPSNELERLAVGSDAWIAEQPLLEQVWGVSGENGLQLLMNGWSDAKHFKDDASLIVVEREL